MKSKNSKQDKLVENGKKSNQLILHELEIYNTKDSSLIH